MPRTCHAEPDWIGCEGPRDVSMQKREPAHIRTVAPHQKGPVAFTATGPFHLLILLLKRAANLGNGGFPTRKQQVIAQVNLGVPMRR